MINKSTWKIKINKKAKYKSTRKIIKLRFKFTESQNHQSSNKFINIGLDTSLLFITLLSIYPSFHLYTWPSVHLSVCHLSFRHLSVCAAVQQAVVCLFINLAVGLFYSFILLSASVFSVRLSVVRSPSVCLSVRPSVRFLPKIRKYFPAPLVIWVTLLRVSISDRQLVSTVIGLPISICKQQNLLAAPSSDYVYNYHYSSVLYTIPVVLHC